MGKLIKHLKKKPSNHFFHTKPFVNSKTRLIGKGIPLSTKRTNISESPKNLKARINKENPSSKKPLYSFEDLIQAFGRPDLVGSKGFLNYKFQTIKEKGKNIRLVLIQGAAVPKIYRRTGQRVALHKELLRTIYKKYGELVKSDKNIFVQTQISSLDVSSLNTLTKRLGYSIFSQNNGIIVLRKKLESKEMQKFLKKKSFWKNVSKKNLLKKKF